MNFKEGVHSISIEHHGRIMGATTYFPACSRFPIVIFSHGFNGYQDDFQHEAHFLMQKGIGAITFTFCGSGARDSSAFETTEMTLYTEAEDLSAVMDFVKTLSCYDGNLFLFGGSQGGMVSAMVAHRRPKDVTGLILLYPAFCIPDDWNARYSTDESIPECIDCWGVLLGRNFVLSLRNLNVYSAMSKFFRPVLLFHGSEDAIVPLRYSVLASKAYPNVNFIIFAGERHGFSPLRMADVQKKMLNFVKNYSVNWR